MLEECSRVYARIDLDAILYNLENIKKAVPEGVKVTAVIKADGYGHGAVPIAKIMEDIDYIWGYATATAEEAFELRDAGIKKPILVLGYTFPYAYSRMLDEGIRPAVFRVDMLDELCERVKKKRANGFTGKMPVHIAVDTGMSRIGVRPDDFGASFVEKAMSMDELEVEGIFTHFARADEADLTNAHEREKVFADFLERLCKESGKKIPICHCANSASIIDFGQASMDMVRAGIILYGLWPSDEVARDRVLLKPALSLHSHIVYIKDVPENTPVSYGGTFVTDRLTRIATIPVGYADGYPRSLSNKGYVLIHGAKAPILGRVCMDQFMVDITHIPEAKEGDEVTLIGRNGDEVLSMEELGDMSHRFNYELACDINKRVPRIYFNDGQRI
ncbi:MAG: alanine racemase [Butyrivibrio sp.]|nr:alanine racemase [Butyrivibrio sp.]